MRQAAKIPSLSDTVNDLRDRALRAASKELAICTIFEQEAIYSLLTRGDQLNLTLSDCLTGIIAAFAGIVSFDSFLKFYETSHQANEDNQ